MNKLNNSTAATVPIIYIQSKTKKLAAFLSLLCVRNVFWEFTLLIMSIKPTALLSRGPEGGGDVRSKEPVFNNVGLFIKQFLSFINN